MNTHDAFNHELDVNPRTSTDEMAIFASRLRSVSKTPLSDEFRSTMWDSIVASQPKPARSSVGAGPLSQPVVRKRSPRSFGFLPQSLPAPAVVFFGIVLAIIFAVTGIGNDGGDMVTPTIHAEQVATSVATPTDVVATSAIVDPPR